MSEIQRNTINSLKIGKLMKSMVEFQFNNGECKKTCNCIDIAEAKNGGDHVKNYECLDFKRLEG